MTDDREVVVDEEFAKRVIAGVASKLAADVLANGATPETFAQNMARVLGEDVGGLALFASSYDEGFEDAKREAVIAGEIVNAVAVDPTWSDVQGLGMRKTIARETNACARCAHASVCVVANAARPDLLIVISRCLAFAPTTG